MSLFDIDSDIRKAKTLPSEFYTDERFFDLSKEKIFARTWQFAGHSDEISTLKPFSLLPDFLDEPLLLARTNEGVRCLSNVCTHRGKILVEEPCKANLIRCGYHGRRFSLDGKFLSMPEFEDVENFPTDADNLQQIPLAQRGEFLFTALKPIVPFDEFVNDAAVVLCDVEPAGLKLASTREYEVNAHWALYCENYLEGFHIPFVHKSLNEVVDYGTYKTETFRYSSLQTAMSAPGAVATGFFSSGARGNPVATPTRRGSDQDIAARYLFIFPNTMFNFYPWGISVNVVEPLTPSKTRVRFLTYIADDSKIEEGAAADLHGVEMEDETVVESVQKGIRSRYYSHGRYSPTREQGTHHFHRLIEDFLS